MAEDSSQVPPIRLADSQDAPAIAQFLTQLGHPTTAAQLAERWASWSAAGNTALVLTGPERSAAGVVTLHRMLVLHRPQPVGRITALFVDVPERGKGLGRALVAAAEEQLARSGCGLLELTSHERFRDAYTFYEHLGYQRTSLRFAKVLTSAGPMAPAS